MEVNIKRTPLAVAMLLALSSTQAVAAPGDTAGSEFQVNTYTSSNQRYPSIAQDADGDFVITWQSRGQDDSGDGIYAQRYNTDGSPAGGEFRVNTVTTGSQYRPSIALDADGDFVIAWQSSGQGGGSGYDIYAQRYNGDGSPAGGEFQVNTYINFSQRDSSIALDADGDFVIAWKSYRQDGDSHGIYAQRYNADGSPAGSEFQVNTFTANSQSDPGVALDADGDFVIAWQSVGQDGSTYGIYAQRYNADGSPAGSEFQVNTFTTSHQANPSIALDADGDFVIAWRSYGQDGSNNGIYAQRYNADGSPAGSEFQVNTFITLDQRNPSIALDADGDFVIAWASNGQDGDGSGVYAQRYLGAGQTIDLSLVVQDDTDPVTVGNKFIYSLITTNNGSGIALDVNLSEPLPSGLGYVSDDSATAGWNCAQVVATLECNKAFMNAAEISTINVTVTATTVGTQSNTVTASAAQVDANAVDNTDTETTDVLAAPDVPAADVPAASGGGGGSLGVFSLLLALPLWLRRRWMH